MDNPETNIRIFKKGETLTTEEFVRRSRVTHGDRFDYPDEYVASKQKIRIICRHHGSFYQYARDHISGHGCKKCAKTPGKWSVDEDNVIRENYQDRGAYWCSDTLNRSEHSIRGRAAVLGLSKKQTYTHPHIPQYIWSSIVRRAEVDGFDMDIDIDFIWNLFLEQKGLCALTGWKISFNKERKLNTVSVDRIDSTRGYLKTNIQLTNKLVNRCKLNCPEDLFYDICKSVYLNKKAVMDNPTIDWEWDIYNDTERPVQVIRNHVRDNELFFHPAKIESEVI
jgi:hypothetical protein